MQVMKTLVTTTVRDLVIQVNEREIQKEDIVSLVSTNSQYILIYYK